MSLHWFVLASRITSVALIVVAFIFIARSTAFKTRLIWTGLFAVAGAFALVSFVLLPAILKGIETKPFQAHLAGYASAAGLAMSQQVPAGKMLPVSIGALGLDVGGHLVTRNPRKPEIDGLYFYLPSATRAETPDDVKLVVWVAWERRESAHYADDSAAYQIVCTVFVIDRARGVIVDPASSRARSPTHRKEERRPGAGQLEDIHGLSLVAEIVRYLQTLPGTPDVGLSRHPWSVFKDTSIVEERKPNIRSTIGHDEEEISRQLLYERWGSDNVEAWNSEANRPVPPDPELLIVASPRKDFLPEALERISDYLRDGGRVLFIAAPAVSERGISKQGNLQAWLAKSGAILGGVGR